MLERIKNGFRAGAVCARQKDCTMHVLTLLWFRDQVLARKGNRIGYEPIHHFDLILRMPIMISKRHIMISKENILISKDIVLIFQKKNPQNGLKIVSRSRGLRQHKQI